MVGYIILGATLSLFLGFAIVALTWGRKIKFPRNCRKTTQEYSWCTAHVLVDKNVPYNDGKYEINGELVSEKHLMLACAATMKTVNFYGNKYKLLGSKGNLKEAAFIFLDDAAYDKKTAMHGTKSNGFSDMLPPNMSGAGLEVSYMRAKFIPQVAVSGHLAIHEFLHCFLKKATGNWDAVHEANNVILENGKNIEQLSNDTVRIILENKLSKIN